MAKRPGVEQIIPDLEAHMQESFNDLIRTTMKRLATKKRSPVDTGFFASSWKAALSPIQPVDNPTRQNLSPWSELRQERSQAFFAGREKPKSYSIKPRFYPPDRQFNYKQRAYIGNSAEYAIYALESGKVQSFIQGPEMARLVKEKFKERKPRLSVASTVKEGVFGATAGETYIGYTEI